MRRRRAERCLLRAEEALAQGRESDAREAHDEAWRLTPSEVPGFDELRTRVAERSRPVDIAAPVVDQRWRLGPAVVAMFAIAATLIGAALFVQRDERPTRQAGAAPVAVGPSVSEPPGAPSAPAALTRQETVRAATDVADDIVAAVPESTVGPLRVSMSSEPPPVPITGAEPAPPELPAAPSVVVAPPPAPPPAPIEIPRASADATLDSLTTSLPSAPSTVPAAGVPAAPAPAPEPAELRIRAVLASYESAFGELDAPAARRVWPTVDERALSRAFEGLASQSISLGGCDISVQETAATARCTGTATWAPKVGGGQRTEARRWDFALEKSGSTWQIVRANVR